MNVEAAFFQATGLSKSFGGAQVVTDVSLDIGANQVIGIVGENGAGKTTLFNMISGIVRPDAGSMTLDGRPFSPKNYLGAKASGISRVFQEQALIPNILVYENLLLSYESMFTRLGQILDKKKMIEMAKRIVEPVGLDIDVRRPTSDYSFSKRQLIEIARACLVPTELLGINHPVVLLDEPTSALEKGDDETFRKLISRLRKRSSIVFVSHRLTEVLELTDIIYVLKDGHLVERLNSSDADERTLHGLMVGRDRESDYYHEASQIDEFSKSNVFSAKGLSRADEYVDVSFDVRQGEVVGLGGLMNSGKSEFGKGAAGIVPPDKGEVVLGDGSPEAPSIHKLVGEGLAYIPAERLTEGMISAFTASWNLSLAGRMENFVNRFGLWRHRHEQKVTEKYISDLSIKAPGAAAVCATLSGGNQQKIVLSRWLCRNPTFMILDNPTRGVDAGAKEEIYKLIRNLCARNVGILLITDDLLELIGLSSRVIIMQHGRIAKVINAPARSKPTERQLIEAMLTEVAPSDPVLSHHGSEAAP